MKRTGKELAAHLRFIRKEVKETPMYQGPTWAFQRRANCVSQDTANYAGRAVSDYCLEAVGKGILDTAEAQMKLKVLTTQWALELNYPWDGWRDMPVSPLFPELWA
jgi:hypothetical protein